MYLNCFTILSFTNLGNLEVLVIQRSNPWANFSYYCYSSRYNGDFYIAEDLGTKHTQWLSIENGHVRPKKKYRASQAGF